MTQSTPQYFTEKSQKIDKSVSSLNDACKFSKKRFIRPLIVYFRRSKLPLY